MSGPTKQSGAGAAGMALVPLALPKDETKMVLSYRATSEQWRSDAVAFANTLSKMFPLVKESGPPMADGLRLAAADGKQVPK